MAIDKIPLTLIEDNPFQPRRTYHKEDIDSLAASIKAHGLLQVPPARRNKGAIQLAFGHLRLRAFRKLAEKSEKWSRMPLDIREITDEDMALFALEENLKRRDITPIEVARALNKYLEKFPKQTELQLAGKVGMTQGNVSNMRRVLRLPAKVLDKIDEGRITFTMGRELLVLQGFKADEDITDEELMLLAIRGVQVPGSQNDMRKPFTVEGLQQSIHEVACARFFTLDKEHADANCYYSGKELLFDAEAICCIRCEKALKTHPNKTAVANWCTNKTCWMKHQEEQKIEDEIAKSHAESKNISQEIFKESAKTSPSQQTGSEKTKPIDVQAADNRRQAEQAGVPPPPDVKTSTMTIDEAIKHITDEMTYWENVDWLSRAPALKLAIEALRWIKNNRADQTCLVIRCLPGETEG